MIHSSYRTAPSINDIRSRTLQRLLRDIYCDDANISLVKLSSRHYRSIWMSFETRRRIKNITQESEMIPLEWMIPMKNGVEVDDGKCVKNPVQPSAIHRIWSLFLIVFLDISCSLFILGFLSIHLVVPSFHWLVIYFVFPRILTSWGPVMLSWRTEMASLT